MKVYAGGDTTIFLDKKEAGALGLFAGEITPNMIAEIMGLDAHHEDVRSVVRMMFELFDEL